MERVVNRYHLIWINQPLKAKRSLNKPPPEHSFLYIFARHPTKVILKNPGAHCVFDFSVQELIHFLSSCRWSSPLSPFILLLNLKHRKEFPFVVHSALPRVCWLLFTGFGLRILKIKKNPVPELNSYNVKTMKKKRKLLKTVAKKF